MSDGIRGSDRRLELIDIIRRVRGRWKMRLALRGMVIVLAGTLLALLLSASSLEALKFSPTAIVAFRITAFLVFAGLLFIGLVRPLRRRVTDSQVALYLEEKDPTLQTALLSAVEASTTVQDDSDKGPSPRLVERIVEQAIDRCRSVEYETAVERQSMRRQLMALGSVAAAAALIIALGPAFLRHGLSALLVVSRAAEDATPYKIAVTPGNAKIPRGTDQQITATLEGFSAADASVMMRTESGGQFERVPLNANADKTTFEGVLFQIQRPTEYYIDANGVRSPVFSLEVMDLPTVDRLVLEYKFPAYTGLDPRVVDPGGDIAALQGTEVRVKVSPTMATPSGLILLNETDSAALTSQPDGTLTGTFTITAQGFYRIELEGPQAEKVNASPKYTIDVLADLPPTVAFSKPGRDTSANPVEEVFAEVKADDDYGVKNVQMFYSVNGGPEKTIGLFGGSKPLQEVTATHTIYLEELGLKAGDFVSYYAKASDNDGVRGAKTTTSDIYFVEIRPFRKDYKPAQSMAGGGGGGGGGQEVGQLSRQQREIVSATFNIVRDRAKMTAEKFRENTVFLTLAQARLREQVEELSEKMNSRLDVVDPAFKTIAEALPKAAAEMKLAEGELKGQKAKEALSPEQRALKLLQDAEQNYEMQVAMNQQGGGGGGGGQNQLAEDLADLFELEMDKLANQYEMQQRAEQQGGDRQVDELVEKLKELARRQQQEAERQRRLAASGQSSGSGGSEAQRQLAQEVEEAARRLQQLTREQQRQELSDALRQLQDAANAMKQAAANGSQDGGAQAQAALERLRQAQQRLERNRSGRGERDVQQAIKQAEELAREARDVEKQVQGLEGLAGSDRQFKAQQLGQRKDSMDSRVADLQDQLEKLSNQARGEERPAARKLDEAAGSITDKRIREMIRYSKNALQGSPSEYARAVEGQIGTNLEALRKKIEDAAAAFGDADKQDALGRAMDKTRDLVRGMESLDQRMRDRARQQGQQEQDGKPGQQGQQGQQQGQQAQNGQQGQQGGQQGQSGQQGQGGQEGGNQQGGAQEGGAQAGGAFGGTDFGSRAGGGYAWGDARYWNGRYSPDDVRQFRNELRQWQGDAQELRNRLNQAGVDPRELDQIIRDLKALDSDQNFVDPANLLALQAAALDKLKRFEFGLRKKAEANNKEELALSGSDEVPAGFRTAIEEYYRALARKR
ncbi:MAG: DUF4175 domain-containing protein [Acidimicrobiia bacterium]|nr:DUF4175 domain-containing protein [Acidimicrobiia bacterium]